MLSARGTYRVFFSFSTTPHFSSKEELFPEGDEVKIQESPSKFWGLGLLLPPDLLVLARLNRYHLRRRFIEAFYKKSRSSKSSSIVIKFAFSVRYP